jgi:hypothetical protein
MVGKAVILAFAALATAIPIDTNQQAASGAPATANVTVRTLPATLYTVVEGVDRTLDDRTASAHADPQEGDRVEAGQIIGRVGMSGYAGVPHIHFNLIYRAQVARCARTAGALLRLRTNPDGRPQRVDRGNPVTDWLIRNREDSWPSR